ncbi:dihydropteroate synthase [Streptomonospora wellingtoniae]|uniref:Dihydropteroate synthase n=1 Tax=Streptomonospora wellingtoniae TaxID=3075544 RepID=A0ABU2KUP5_9ACTN|nr:dihydropteroate synthase [Streptomonospora sp. DSM 45055]MDT0302783.1 dihydropteroate synthase [Streptomonospora sp. DSM 45055]
MSDEAAPGGVLRLRGREFGPGSHAVMAVVNRTPDSFYDRGATYDWGAALAAADAAVASGADIVDVGGVKAGHGAHVGAAEEIGRTAPFVAELRARHPQVVISVDTWRAEVGRACAEAGADLVNDTWAGADPDLARVAAEAGAGLVCSHTGGLAPRTDPHRVHYADVVADVLETVTGLARRAVALGVRPDRVLIDPTHDFGKNTYHSLELTRRMGELAATGWPVLVAVSNKDFIGETLDAPVEQRGPGTLAALAVSAWQDARVFRVHDAGAARAALDAVAGLRASGGGGRSV